MAIYNKVDVSPLTMDIITDDDTPTDLTMVLWEIDNQTDNTIRYGNSAITYVLDDRLKINPTSDVVWEPERIGPTWNRAPTSGHYTDIEPGVKTRWVGLVDIPDSSKLDLVILNSRDHKPMAFDLSDEHFADESNLPY